MTQPKRPPLAQMLKASSTALLCAAGLAAGAHAQALSDIKPQPPLTLKARGSFMVGGESTPQTRHLCPGTTVTFTPYDAVGRMRTDFAIPNFHLPSYLPEKANP